MSKEKQSMNARSIVSKQTLQQQKAAKVLIISSAALSLVRKYEAQTLQDFSQFTFQIITLPQKTPHFTHCLLYYCSSKTNGM